MKAGVRQVGVTERRTNEDFARIMQRLVGKWYAEADKIILVMDNLSMHTTSALYGAFAPRRRGGWWRRSSGTSGGTTHHPLHGRRADRHLRPEVRVKREARPIARSRSTQRRASSAEFPADRRASWTSWYS